MPTATPTATALPGGLAGGRGCAGDCSGNRIVTVDELITGVSILLGLRSLNDCSGLDDNRDGRVVVNELVAAVSRLLFGCDFTPPTPTNTPTGGEQSVCGSPITTVPQVCGLTIMPTRVRRGGTITLSFGLVDREGDIDRLCAGIGPVGNTPALQCMNLTPPNMTINIFGSDSTTVGLPIGRYTFGLQVFDRAGNASQIITADFEVIFIRV